MDAHGARARVRAVTRPLEEYGMLGVLLILVAIFSVLTLEDQNPAGEAAAKALAGPLAREAGPQARILIAARAGAEDARFVAALAGRFAERPGGGPEIVAGDPAGLRAALERHALGDASFLVVATTQSYAPVVRGVLASIPELGAARLVTPPATRWPTFLLAENLLNVASQIAVIAIVAIGMTLVILTGGIDLSVGSQIALAAVLVAWTVARLGGEGASTIAVVLAGGGAVLACGLTGAFSGAMIVAFRVPPFIATLAMMQVTSGLAYLVSEGKPIYQLPTGFVTLGRGSEPLLGLPWAVLLMLGLYAAAHVVMSRTVLGRYVYAIGGNPEAARLAGVRVGGVLVLVYVWCGMLAGLGGVIMASQLRSGAPSYGLMYELYVIAAVVVGGTSLSGGEGRVVGTLIGAFIIAVIQNGMNLTHVESYMQKVLLGVVILAAVLLDRLRVRRLETSG